MQTPPLSLTLMLGFTCFALALVLGILILGLCFRSKTARRMMKRKRSSLFHLVSILMLE